MVSSFAIRPLKNHMFASSNLAAGESIFPDSPSSLLKKVCRDGQYRFKTRLHDARKIHNHRALDSKLRIARPISSFSVNC
jgi:hypothetical protein